MWKSGQTRIYLNVDIKHQLYGSILLESVVFVHRIPTGVRYHLASGSQVDVETDASTTDQLLQAFREWTVADRET
jgi:hypothetical protein